MNPQTLKQKVVATHGSLYIRALLDGVLVGNAFAVCYEHEGRSICWITQLVVSSSYRNRGIAKLLLSRIHQSSPSTETKYGILSTHPFAVCAFLRVFGQGIEEFDRTEKRDCEVMESCPVGYVAEAKLGGGEEKVCLADTKFWVDHGEPMAALARLRKGGVEWPLGELPDGCEFLAIVSATESLA